MSHNKCKKMLGKIFCPSFTLRLVIQFKEEHCMWMQKQKKKKKKKKTKTEFHNNGWNNRTINISIYPAVSLHPQAHMIVQIYILRNRVVCSSIILSSLLGSHCPGVESCDRKCAAIQTQRAKLRLSLLWVLKVVSLYCALHDFFGYDIMVVERTFKFVIVAIDIM